jgi:hypothetical protein
VPPRRAARPTKHAPSANEPSTLAVSMVPSGKPVCPNSRITLHDADEVPHRSRRWPHRGRPGERRVRVMGRVECGVSTRRLSTLPLLGAKPLEPVQPASSGPARSRARPVGRYVPALHASRGNRTARKPVLGIVVIGIALAVALLLHQRSARSGYAWAAVQGAGRFRRRASLPCRPHSPRSISARARGRVTACASASSPSGLPSRS